MQYSTGAASAEVAWRPDLLRTFHDRGIEPPLLYAQGACSCTDEFAGVTS